MKFVLRLHLVFYISKISLNSPQPLLFHKKNTSMHENPVRDSPSNYYISKLYLIFCIYPIISLKEYLILTLPFLVLRLKKYLSTKVLRIFVLLERKKNRSNFVFSRQMKRKIATRVKNNEIKIKRRRARIPGRL